MKIVHVDCSRLLCLFCSRIYDNIYYYKVHLVGHLKNRNRLLLQSPPNSIEKPEKKTVNYDPFFEQKETLNTTSNEDFHSNMNYSKEFMKFVLSFYSKSEIPRKYSVYIINECIKFFQSILQNEFMISKNVRINKLKELFSPQNVPTTDYRLLESLRRDFHLVKIDTHIIHTKNEETTAIDNNLKIRNIVHSVKVTDLVELFSFLFKHTNVINHILSYVDSMDDDYLQSIVQTKFFKDKVRKCSTNDNIMCLPLFVFFDDFEVNNPLGSHANITKLGGVYVKIPCLPPYLQSKLNSIFLGMLFYSEDRKLFGNVRIFKPFVEELKKLFEEEINIEHHKYNSIKLIPCLLLGDNLGLNSALGFSESFSANFYCRFCTSSKTECSSQCIPHNSKNYTIDSYNYYLANPGNSSIKEYSIWNELPLFHVVKNFSVDPMHDLLEGVCKYDFLFLLDSFIVKQKLFTIEQLNFRISTFNFGPYNINKPPLFRNDFFKHKKIRMSAAEMHCFVRYFSLLVGDLIPPQCIEWQLYISLRKILNYSFANTIDQNTWKEMHSVIIEHNDLYLQLSELTLTPKFHNLLHYPQIMRIVGPLKHLSSMRFESFHQLFKRSAYTTKCKQNIIETLAVKHSIQISNIILNFNNLTEHSVKCGKKQEIDSEIKRKYNFQCSETAYAVNFVHYNHYFLKKKSVIRIYNQLAVVDFIFKYKENFFLALSELKINFFDWHFLVYEVEKAYKYYVVPLKNIKLDKISYICELSDCRQVVDFDNLYFGELLNTIVSNNK